MVYPDEQIQTDLEYTDQEEYQDNFLDDQRESWDDSGGNYPMAKRPDSLFSLFKSVWKINDSSKVGNLDKSELGDLGISVRHAQEIGHFSKYLRHKAVSKHFANLAEITLSTSMSRKGWFVELFVTSKKFAHKGSLGSGGGSGEAGANPYQQQAKSKWRIFGKNPANTVSA